jgi:hypothetical protein
MRMISIELSVDDSLFGTQDRITTGLADGLHCSLIIATNSERHTATAQKTRPVTSGKGDISTEIITMMMKKHNIYIYYDDNS